MKLNLSYRNGFFRAQKKRQIDAPNEHPSAAPLSVLPESSALGKFKYRQSCPVGGPSRAVIISASLQSQLLSAVLLPERFRTDVAPSAAGCHLTSRIQRVQRCHSLPR